MFCFALFVFKCFNIFRCLFFPFFADALGEWVGRVDGCLVGRWAGVLVGVLDLAALGALLGLLVLVGGHGLSEFELGRPPPGPPRCGLAGETPAASASP